MAVAGIKQTARTVGKVKRGHRAVFPLRDVSQFPAVDYPLQPRDATREPLHQIEGMDRLVD